MGYREPPDLRGKTLDFSEFHPLDHRIWEAHCRGLPGGRRRHFELRWSYITKPALRSWTTCRMGWHESAQVWRCDPPGIPASTYTACFHCGKRLSEEQPR
jgi:hypothetical protein